MIDHHATAEQWVARFHDIIGDTPPAPRDMLLLAHIHALLALDLGPPRLLDLGGEPLSTEEADALKARFLSHYPDKS